MKLSLSSALLALLGSQGSRMASALGPDEMCETNFPSTYQSDLTSDVVKTVITQRKAPWIQLDLSGTKLAEYAELHIKGKDESATETITAAMLARSPFSSVFDGSSVSLELVPPMTIAGDFGFGGMLEGENDEPVSSSADTLSRLVVSSVNAGVCDDDTSAASICGPDDDRMASQDRRAGRIGGCTGWLISEDVFVQAGHCGTPTASRRMHFTFSRFSAPAEDQYAVDLDSYVGVNGGVGNDWGVGRLLPNAHTNLLPGVAQGGWYTIGEVPSQTAGNNIRITGYGVANVESRSQKTHTGALVTIGATHLRYIPDTTGGNSGSPVIHEETGHAIGVHTHGGCSASGGSNIGTSINNVAFKAAIDALLGTPATTTAATNPVTTTTATTPGATTTAACTSCTDNPSPWMANNGKACDGSPGIMRRRCNGSPWWTNNNYCQNSCYLAGRGYDGDVCCSQCVQCTDVATPWMVDNGKTCATSSAIQKKCNQSPWWISGDYCQQSCFDAGRGYVDCCISDSLSGEAIHKRFGSSN